MQDEREALVLDPYVRICVLEQYGQALLQFDWVYRLRAIYDILGLAPTEGMLSRQRRLREVADLIRNGNTTADVHVSASGAEPSAIS